MTKSRFALLLGVLLIQGVSAAQAPNENLALNSEQWRADLRFIHNELPKLHKNAFHTVTNPQLTAAVAELDARMSSLNTDEIVVGLMRVTAMIGDAHTGLRPPKAFQWYPIRLFQFGKELRVLRTAPEYKHLLGLRVVRVGKTDIAAAYQLAQRLIPAENEWFLKEEVPAWLVSPNALRGLGLIGKDSAAPFTFANDKGNRITPALSASALDAKLDWVYPSTEPLRYFQKPDEDVWFTQLDDGQTVYVNWRGYFGTADQRSKELLSYIDSHPVKRLVIDLRANGGGNFIRGRRFIAELKKRPALAQPGAVFALTGRRTGSAAVVNAMDLRRDLQAILVGEPTGEKPNTYGDLKLVTLPNSGLALGYSSNYYKFQDKEEPAVMPDKFIEPTWADYKLGRDAALEWVISYQKNK
jgi:hypothetical protein